MTITYVLMQNLRRNPLRSALTMAAFALPMAIFVAAISFVVTLVQLNQRNAAQSRLAVQNKIALINPLPERMRREIEGLDPDRKRMVAACGVRWFGGRVPDTPNVIQSLGADADTFPEVFSEFAWTAEEEENWRRERTACAVGASLAEEKRWQVGSRVTLESTVPPYLSLEFKVVKIIRTEGRGNVLYLRRDYFEESRSAAGFTAPGCNVFWIKCRGPAALQSLGRDIDAAYANSPNETKSMDENAFVSQFIESSGNLPGLMQAMAVVVVVIVALVAGNTMMMSFRERMREIAVFKAIGFPSGRIFRIVLAESALLALLGALLGIAPTAAALTWLPIRRMGSVPLSLDVSWVAIVISLAIALLVGLAAGLLPALQALRLNTVSALRRVG
ncbi:MAG: FtsX-like permease family protein [Phycisphaerae bacterium]